MYTISKHRKNNDMELGCRRGMKENEHITGYKKVKYLTILAIYC